MIVPAIAAVTGGTVLVRLGWSGRRPVALAGWAVVGAALLAVTLAEGAWGLAVGSIAGTVVALAAVLLAGWRSPARLRRPARIAPAVSIPVTLPDLARRAAVFALTVPVSFVAAQWLAFAVQAYARGRGAGEADRIVLALLLQPVAWAAIMTVQMTRAGPLRMVSPPAVAALIGAAFWAAT